MKEWRKKRDAAHVARTAIIVHKSQAIDSTNRLSWSLNIISIGQMTNSQIQQDSPQATQEVVIGKNMYEELKKVLQSLKESIDQFGLEPQQKSIFKLTSRQ